MRFDAHPGKPHYMKADENQIMFGNGDLTINKTFDRASSVIKPYEKKSKKKLKQEQLAINRRKV